nr:reverse transcriptase domain-containing protein [Tanacetum cinerariifolium]
IVDFLSAHTIRYALTVNPTIYDSCIEQFWSSAMTKTINGESQIHAKSFDKINKTQSKATPNESSSQGTDSGGGPRCQEAIGDTIAQTRCENVSKLSNDLLLARGNTLQSDKDRLKQNELMELCTNLQSRVLDLEKTKTTQALEIYSLKIRVKKLEKKQRSRTHKLKRLYKVSLTARVDSSKYEQSLGKDTPKQGRKIDDIDQDEDITLVNDQDDTKMFDVNNLQGEEVFVEREVADKEVNAAGEINDASIATTDKRERAKKELEANIALIETWDDVQAKIDADYQMAERLQAKEQQELTDEEKATLFMQLLEKKRKFFAAKRAKEKRNKPPTQAQQRKIMCTYLKNVEGKKLKDLKNKSFDSIQKMFDKAFKRQKVEDDKEIAELKQLMEIIPNEEEVAINAIPLAVKNLFPSLDNPELTIRRRSRSDPTLLNNSEMAAEGPSDLPVRDLRTMEELCQPSLNGQGGPIASIAIQATNFGLKNDMIQQVQNSCQFHGLPAQQSETSSSITSSFDTEIAALKPEMAKINKNLMRPPLATLKTFMLREPTKTEATKDTVHPTNNGSTKDVQPLVVQSESLIQNSKPVNSPIIESVASLVSAPRPNQRPSIPYPSRLHDQKLRDKANDQREKFFQIFKDLNFNISFADALILMPKFGSSIKSLLTNKDKLCELARTPLNEHCSAILQKKLPEKLGDPGKARRSFDFSSGWGSRRCLCQSGNISFPGRFRCRELTLRVGKDAITFNLDQTSRYSANYNDMTANCIDVIDMPYEEYSQEVLCFSNVIASGNPTPYYDPIVSTTSLTLTPFENKYSQEVLCFSNVISSGNPTPYYDPIVSTTSLTLTPFENSDFLLEEVDAFLALEDDSTSPEVDQSYLDTEGEIILLESFLNNDPSLPLPNQGNYLPEVRKELKIYLSVEEKTALITVLKSHKRAIAWKLSDIKGIDPEFCTHKILMEEDFEPAVQHHPWVGPVQCVLKRGGFTVVENEENELIPTRLITGWHVCINYHKLNEATRKDHFLLPFMDQILERLARNQYYCFLDGFSGYFQIPIDPKDQEKTTFTCPYGTFAYHRMPFGLCNAPDTFQRCMMAIFHDMIEKTMEVFMDDFSVFRNSFQSYLSHLEKMLKRCEDTNLCLNWEKSHFMVKEGIVLGHKISKEWIEVDKAKVDVITKLPHPTTVKECVETFQTLKRKLTEALILIAPDWDMPFELMCDASDFAIGAVLRQH